MNHPHSYVIPVATINAKCNLNSLWRPTQHSGRTKSHTAMDCLLLGTCASRCLQPATGDASCSIRPAHWVICTVLALKLFPRLLCTGRPGNGAYFASRVPERRLALLLAWLQPSSMTMETCTVWGVASEPIPQLAVMQTNTDRSY